MPRPVQPKPHQEIPPYEVLVALRTWLERFPDNPLAVLILATLVYGESLWKKEVQAELTFQLEQASRPPDDPKSSEKAVKVTSKILEELLTRDGQAQAVATIHSQYTGVAAVGQALIDKCKEVKLATAMSLVDEAQTEVTRLVRISARVAAGGHPHFDDRVAAIIRELWIITDNGFDAVAIILRTQGVFNDPVYALRPTVKSSLRPVINAPVPASKAAKKPAKPRKTAKKDANNKEEANKKDANTKAETKPPEPPKEEPQKAAGT